MRIAKVVGKVTLNRSLEQFQKATLKMVFPLQRDDLEDLNSKTDKKIDAEETLVAWDLIGVGEGALVAISEGPEASMPFRPEVKPIDASICALLDEVHLKRK